MVQYLQHEFKVEQTVGRRLPEVEIYDGGVDQQQIVLKHWWRRNKGRGSDGRRAGTQGET